MRYATAGAFRAALDHALRNEAAQRGIDVQRLRREIVFQRLLARLMIVAPGRWILKGALALEFRFGSIARPTKDMDLARRDNVDAASADFLAAADVDLGDYFSFAIEKTDALDEMTEANAARYRVIARLAGRVFERVVVDVGFLNVLSEATDFLAGPDLLGFAGIEPVTVPVLPLELHVAEKLHAYSRTYESGSSSRVKDLVDLVLISRHHLFKAGALREALDATFARRDTHALPHSLDPPHPSWTGPYSKMAQGVNLLSELAHGHELASRFLNPVLSGEAEGGALWDPTSRTWNPPRPETP